MLSEIQILRPENLELLARQVVEGFITGLHKSPYHGFSVEFAEHRQYNSGESVRNIDWKLYARTERLYVKRFEEETNLRCRILIDQSGSMYFPDSGLSKLQFSILGAASIMHLMKMQRDAVGLTLFDSTIQTQTEVRSSGSHHIQLLQFLTQLYQTKSGNSGTGLVDTLHEIAERIHRRSMVIIFSDMFDSNDPDAVFDALQHLKYNKHEVILFHTQHAPMELEFDYQNRPYTFQDSETGERIRLFPSEVREAYVDRMNQFHRELKFRAAQYRIDLIEADVSKPIDQILIPFLVKRQRMRG
ncbi:MAG: DUF58 domain-containing protein [Flavobacteriales bacterium]|nr:DUF58 domain-containing protein [Bacteroidota bacterium]MCB9241420.1 DUF58 domain-containing protein [Flavobacteriales bacterium]